MSDDRGTFEVTRARLEDIVVQVRRKDVSLEQSLDLLEEAVRLVNQCNDLIDQTSFRAVAAEGEGAGDEGAVAGEAAPVAAPEEGQEPAAVAVVDVVEAVVLDGDEVVAVEIVGIEDVDTEMVWDLGGDLAEDAEMDEPAAPVAEIEDDERS